MSPFGTMYQYDHRVIYIDIMDDELFDKDEIKIMYHYFRMLKTGIPKRVKEYKKYVSTAWDQH